MTKPNPNPAGPARSSRRRPGTGVARLTKQPLKIDKLPTSVHEAIQYLHNVVGKTWEEIEAQSAEKYSKMWQVKGGGFVNWRALPLPVLELFPDMRLPHTSLHRWFDLRIAQVERDVMLRSKQARMLAEAFAKSTVTGGDQAVINAARDTLMTVLSEDGSAKGRLVAVAGLLKLSEVMAKDRTNVIRERKVSVDERRIAQLEKDAEIRRRRMDEETEKLKKKTTKGEVTPADIDRLRERVFGLPPKAKVEADDANS